MAKILTFQRPASSHDKLKALILHVLGRLGPLTHEQLGAVLWEIDSTAFLTTGRSITGCQYVKES